MEHKFKRPFTENDFARAWKWKDLPAAQKYIRDAYYDITEEEIETGKAWCEKEGLDFEEIIAMIEGKERAKISYLVPEGYDVPQTDFICREKSEWVTHDSEDLFWNRRVLVFSVPTAFDPISSHYQLPVFEEMYDEFISHDIAEIFCVSVDNGYVMNAWAKDLDIQKVKMLPDGNGYFTRQMGFLYKKTNLGYGDKSWRWAAIIDDGVVEKLFVEVGIRHNAETDPFDFTKPETIMDYVKESEDKIIDNREILKEIGTSKRITEKEKVTA